MKAYTDLEQSKRLAEILPIESADMHYNNASIKGINYVDEYRAELMDYNTAQKVLSKYLINSMFEIIPCWSFAALISVLPILDNRSPVISKTFNGKYRVLYHSTAYEGAILTSDYDNPIDACYELILKLHELNLL